MRIISEPPRQPAAKSVARDTLQVPKAKKRNSLLWLFEPLEQDPGFFARKLFSFDAAYLDGRLYVAVSDGMDPRSGLLVCTHREYHPSLMAEIPQLTPHQILGKWLHLPQSAHNFESIAAEIISLASQRDPRLGVESTPRKRRPAQHK